jgi:NADPH:quinone reductase
MRAAVVRAFGPPEGVAIEEWPAPTPRPGEVVVQVLAASVNYADLLMVAGRYQVKPALPFVPGIEFCGLITRVGPDVDRWRPGDRVMGATNSGGCFAEEVAVPAGQIFRAPENLPLELAAQLVVGYGTAAYALTRGLLKAGETILVSGAGGGVGLATIGVALRLGARVFAVAGAPEKLRVAAAHGAHATLHYQMGSLRSAVANLTGGRGVHVVLDTVGGSFFDEALRCLAPHGRILVVGFASGSLPRIPAEYLLLKNLSAIGIGFGGVLATEPSSAQAIIEELLALHAAQPFIAQVDGRLSLDHTTVALQRLADRQVIGKQLLLPGD